jgi:hypothetical protein
MVQSEVLNTKWGLPPSPNLKIKVTVKGEACGDFESNSDLPPSCGDPTKVSQCHLEELFPIRKLIANTAPVPTTARDTKKTATRAVCACGNCVPTCQSRKKVALEYLSLTESIAS